jgi:hypothetical protein
MPELSIDRALSDERLLGAALGSIDTWRTWLAVLRAAFGLALDDAERAVFAQVAGNRAPPNKRVRELWAVIGRRGGKSRCAALIACYIALFTKHKLAHGERGLVLVIASSMEQAKTVFSYALAFLRSSPVLNKEIEEAPARSGSRTAPSSARIARRSEPCAGVRCLPVCSMRLPSFATRAVPRLTSRRTERCCRG